LAFAEAAKAEGGPVTYYVQLVRGSDSDQAPQAMSNQVGNKLAKRFHGVFKWKYYWEICQRQVEVLPGRILKVPLCNGRDVEIDLTKQEKRAVTAYQDHKLVDQTIQPVGEAMTLIGGDRDQKSAWFIVVRRDKPGK
jgi:hypothetical protein